MSIIPVNNADLIVQTLQNAGVTHGFGIPSGNVLPMIDAMRRAGMEFVLTAHEGSASFAADVMGRLTGKPGFCIATLGPGATNLSTGVGSAYLDRSPMIAITCNLNTSQLGRRIQMWIDHHALFRPITKATLSARHDNVAEVMREAISIALAEPQGPVHIDLPEDVSLAEAKGVAPVKVKAATELPNADAAAIAKASAIISEAKRPLAVIGSSAMRMLDPQKLRAFLEKHYIPFATTTMAKGLVDDKHPLAIGCIERGRRQVQRSFIRSCDLIIGLGYDTIEVEYEAWSSDVPVLSLDIEPPDVAASVNLKGTVAGNLDDILERMANIDTINNSWDDTEIAAHRK